LDVVEALDAWPPGFALRRNLWQAACHNCHEARGLGCINKLRTSHTIVSLVDKPPNIGFRDRCHTIAWTFSGLSVCEVNTANKHPCVLVNLLHCQKRIGPFITTGVVRANEGAGQIAIRLFQLLQHLEPYRSNVTGSQNKMLVN
jgi:hypothetical protein